MHNIQLEGRTITSAEGLNVNTAPALLERCQKGEGVILSEADIRLLGVRNFENSPELANNYWDTSTLSATKGKTVKVILPYETNSRKLTEAARFGLSLINPRESLVHGGINLDLERGWERLEGKGVYTRERDEWFEKGKRRVLVGLNRDMTEKQAGKCPLLLTKLQHPNYVDSEFARTKDEVDEIIGRTFELGKQEHGYRTMMGQWLPDVSGKGILSTWYVSGLDYMACSDAAPYFDSGVGRFAFDRLKDSGHVEKSKSSN